VNKVKCDESLSGLFSLHRKNDFDERSKILLDTDLKIILLDHQNNFVGTLKIMSNAAKNFDFTNWFEHFTQLF